MVAVLNVQVILIPLAQPIQQTPQIRQIQPTQQTITTQLQAQIVSAKYFLGF